MADGKSSDMKNNERRRAERLARLVDDAVDISERFAREPVLARTGKGYYKSVGVEGLKKDIQRLRALQKDDHSK